MGGVAAVCPSTNDKLQAFALRAMSLIYQAVDQPPPATRLQL